jgi:putative thioredoxin
MKNIIEVTEINFEPEVMAYSKNTPVILDFWAEWCHPCKALGLVLERVIDELGGKFRLAKLNVDEIPNLTIQFNVSSIPTLKAVSNGAVVGEMIGNQPETRVREFLAKITPPNPASLENEKGQSFLLDHKWTEARMVFRKVLEGNPDLSSALLGLAISLLALNEPEEAEAILRNFPASKEFSRAQVLLPYANLLLETPSKRDASQSDLEEAFEHSIEFARKAKFELATEGLLDVVRMDKNYGKGIARQIILSFLEILGLENNDSRGYRSELASILH